MYNGNNFAFRGDLEVGGALKRPITSSNTGSFTFYVGEKPDDFASLQDAVDALSIQSKKAGDKPATVLIRDGYLLPGRLLCRDGDYSHIVLAPETDGTKVFLDSDVTYPSSGAVLDITNAKSPVVGCLIDAQSNGWNGLRVSGSGAAASVLAGAGIINAQNHALLLSNGAHADIANAIFRGAGTDALRVTHGSSLYGCNVDASSAGKSGATVASTSRAHLDGSSFSDLKGNNVAGISVSGNSAVSAHGAYVSGSDLSAGAEVSSASSLDASNLRFIGSSRVPIGVRLQGAARADLASARLEGWSNVALHILRGSSVDATDVTTDLNGSNALQVSDTNVGSFNAISSNGIIFTQ